MQPLDGLDDCIRNAMRAAARAKLEANEASDAIDREPHDVYAIMCMARAAQEDRAKTLDKEALELAYRKSLESIGMRIDERGRYMICAPKPCGHGPSERNTGRDQLTCDGCRKAP